ncbi:MAG: CocE/NonD family hydrolase [Desulfobacterales bacterium]
MSARKPLPLIALLAALLGIGSLLSSRLSAGQEKVSAFGRYQGYSKAAYDGSTRSSKYLELTNGTRLAYDLILPALRGAPAAVPLPVLFKYTPYLRTFTIFDENGKNIIAELTGLGWKERAMLRIRYWVSDCGRLMDPLFRTPWLEGLVRHGYAVIVVERPGTGASFGSFDPSHEPGGREADEIMNWIAAQPWCDGNIGMYGDSFQAMVQMAAAAMSNPHLKAVFPTSTSMEMYNAVSYPGGVFNKAFAAFFKWSTAFLQSAAITPVDGDADGRLLAEARQERTRHLSQTTDLVQRFPFRDSTSSNGNRIYLENSALYPFIERINRSGVPVYLTNGWFDLFSADPFFWYRNLTVPRRLVVRPLDHSGVEKNRPDLDYGVEAHRWFDYWLKRIGNGIMQEPPVHYYVMGAPEKDAWRSSDRWPVAGHESTAHYFGGGRTGRSASPDDGSLAGRPPDASEGQDDYRVDYSTTSGKNSRWTAVNWPHRYPDMRANDRKALTYTTAPLETDLEIIGHPIVHLWLATAAADIDAFVYLEAVGPDGSSTYITEGNLRASHRRQGPAPFDNLGLPFHTHFEADLTPIPDGRPFELVFSLLPTAYRFTPGNRIRISVAFADADNFETPVIDPPPALRLLRDERHPSRVLLPVARIR